jgi:pSer/pThr/pTyr-binding forkhead associated (FHA) protein
MNVKLLVVLGRPQGKSFLFPPGEFLFGRGSECHIQPNSEWVSRQHCLLRVTPEDVWVRDLGSRNGTLVNGVRVVGERPLGHGDHLQVGPLVFEIHLDETAPAPQPSAPRPSSAMIPTVPSINVLDTAEHPTALSALKREQLQSPAPEPSEAEAKS